MNSGDFCVNLDKFIGEFKPKYLKPAMANACAVVQKSARENAPKGTTGELQKSIDFEVDEEGTEGVIYSNLEYAPYVEIGTGIYSSRGDGRKTPWVYPMYDKGEITFRYTEGMPPKPYLEPAFTENTSNIRDCFEGLI